MHAGAAAAPHEPPVKRAEEASTAAPVAAIETAPQPLAHDEDAPPIVPDSEVRREARSRSHHLLHTAVCCRQQRTKPPLWPAMADWRLNQRNMHVRR